MREATKKGKAPVGIAGMFSVLYDTVFGTCETGYVPKEKHWDKKISSIAINIHSVEFFAKFNCRSCYHQNSKYTEKSTRR